MMEYFSIQELDLPADIWNPFAQHYAAAHYDPNQMIYFQESQADCFYYLKRGRVKTFISSEDGTEKALTVYREGNLFGEAAFFDGMPRVSSAVAITACDIVRIDRQRATQEIVQNPELALALMKYLARTVRLLSEHIDNMAFLQTDQRIARYLLSLPQSSNSVIRCTQDEIASAVSANRVTVCRILNQFVKSGCIATGYGSIQVLDADSLRTKAAIDT
ncbi:MAG: Crp/Fnr family transcriptional regulator [Oscillospiraceae bacterium]|nr:Crp/Fnr family transcriptional regulator [Eubacteriales bacterium]MDY2617873.1 Crp/Fnr family transcriptional regulator [Oscillospiraceae bacterium]